MQLNLLLKKFISFAGVGLIGTSVQYVTLVLLVYTFSTSPVIASSIGMILGAFTNYYLNHRVTFKSNKKHAEALPKFLTIALIGLLFNGLIMTLFTEYIKIHYLIAQVIATGIVLIWNFLGNLLWTFKN